MPQIVHINPGWFLLICGLVVLAASLMLMLLAHHKKSDETYPAASVILTQPAWYTPVPVYIAQPNHSPVTVRSAAYVSPPPLRIETPVCYDMPRETVLCMGRVFNVTSEMVESVRLRVEMAETGRSAITGLEQRFIAPGSFAPYRVQFNQALEEQSNLVTSLESARLRKAFSYTLAVMDEQGTLEDSGSGRYILTATVLNPYPKKMYDVQIIGTVSDSQGNLTGYRVETLDGGIEAGETRALKLEIIPQLLDETYSHHLTVLAWEE